MKVSYFFSILPVINCLLKTVLESIRMPFTLKMGLVYALRHRRAWTGKERNSAETFTRIVIGSEVLRKNFSQHHDGAGDHAGHSSSSVTGDEEAVGTQLTVDGFAEAIRAQYGRTCALSLRGTRAPELAA